MTKNWRHLIILFGLSLLGLTQLQAQNNTLNWYFGNNAALDFSGEYPVPIVGSQMAAREGVACMSDSLGNLLFYTDGMTVWNANHEVVASSLAGHESATMAASIVPNPLNPDQYYLFTTRNTSIAPDADNNGGHYYLLDFSSTHPEGELIEDYSGQPLQPRSTEKFLSVPFGPDLTEELGIPGYWLYTHIFDSDTFNQFQLTDAVRPYDTFAIGAVHENATADFGANHGAIGYMKVSMTGEFIAVAVESTKHFEVFRFNQETGRLSRFMSLPAGDPDNKKEAVFEPYGVEFSPTGRFLYGSTRDGGTIYQWDLDNFNILETVYILRHNPEIPCGALQLAPDGKIYCAFQDQDYLGVVNRPDRIGKKLSDYEEYGVRLLDNETGLGGTSGLGLPQFDMSKHERKHFGVSNNCYGDTTELYMTGDIGTGYSFNTTFTIMDPESGGIYNILYTDEYVTAKYVFPSPGEYDIRVQSRYVGRNLDFIERIRIHEPVDVNLAEKDYTRLCRGDSMVLDAGNGAFYEWADETYRERKYMVTEEDFAIGLIQEYRVRVQDYNGCIGWDTVHVEIKSPPRVDFEYTKAICGDPTGSATVVPSGGVDNYYYHWEDFPGNTSNRIENVLGGDYVVYVTSKYLGCEASFVATVPELGGANVKIVPSVDAALCPGTSMTLSVSGATLFEWLEPAGLTGEEITVQPKATTTYRVKAISRDELGNECETFAEYTVEVLPEQKPEIGTDQEACEGDTISLTAPDGYASYLWNNGMNGQTISLLESISELALVVIDENNCVFSDTLNIVFHPAPAVELGEDISLCTNEPVVLTGGDGDSYLWNTGETSPSISVLTSGKYELQITRFGCSNSDSVDIEIMNPDSLFIDSVFARDISCFGDQNGSIQVFAHGAGSDYLYSIDNGLTFQDNAGVFSGLPAGSDYRVVIWEDSACTQVYPDPLEVIEPTEISAEFRYVSPSCVSCADGTIILNEIAGGTAPYTVQWSTLDTGLKVTGLTSGEYVAYISDSEGCMLTAPAFLDLGFRIPTAFTPNGDGINDQWVIKVLTTYPNCMVQVFNKTGIKIFESPTGYPTPWDGTVDGTPVSTGTYYYIISLGPDLQPETGNLTIIR